MRRPVDVSRDYVADGDARFAQRLLGDAARHFIEIGADQNQRMLCPALAARGLVLHDLIQMLQKGSIPAAHVADAARLQLQRPIENLDHNLIHLFEVGLVRAAAAPHVHAAIDQQLHAAFIHARHARVAEQQRAQRY